MNIIDLLNEAGVTPKRKASTHGGEYCSPCPFCRDGDDRFSSWPNRPNKDGTLQGGRYSCRVCGKYGDAINFLKDFQGLDYKAACAKLRLEPKARRTSAPLFKPEPLPPIANDPPKLWQDKAKAFVDWSHSQLLNNPEAMAMVTARGFNLETIKRFKLGFNPGEIVKGQQRDFFKDREDWGLAPETKEDGKPKKLWLPIGITIPTIFHGQVIKVKVRRSSYENDIAVYEQAIKRGEKPKYKPQKYSEISGSKQCPAVYGNAALDCVLVMESEFDSILCQQFAGDLLFCIGLGGSQKPLDRDTFQLIKTKQTILFCPDFDDAGFLALAKWKRKFPNTSRIITPDEKAPGDAHLAGIDLRGWLEDCIKTAKRERL